MRKRLIMALGLCILISSSGFAEASSAPSEWSDAEVNAWRSENREKFESFRREGIPAEKIYHLGEEGQSSSFNVGITVNKCEYIENIAAISKEWFDDYDEVIRSADEEGRLEAYQRQMVKIDRDTEGAESVLEEKTVSRELLKVSVAVKNYSTSEVEVPVYGQLCYVEEMEDGGLTWADPEIVYRPADENFREIQTDDRAIGNSLDKSGWTVLQGNEIKTYELIFVADQDRREDILIEIGALFNDLNNGEKNIEGYFSLEKK